MPVGNGQSGGDFLRLYSPMGSTTAWDKIKPWARGEEIDDPMMREYLAVGHRYFEWAADEKRKRRLEKPQGKVS